MASDTGAFSTCKAPRFGNRIVECGRIRHQSCGGDNALRNRLDDPAVHTASETKIICINDEAPHAKSLTAEKPNLIGRSVGMNENPSRRDAACGVSDPRLTQTTVNGFFE